MLFLGVSVASVIYYTNKSDAETLDVLTNRENGKSTDLLMTDF